MIFAWGIDDPDSNNNITYHGPNRGSLIIPLLSYTEPVDESKFAGLNSFEFRVNNVNHPKKTHFSISLTRSNTF